MRISFLLLLFVFSIILAQDDTLFAQLPPGEAVTTHSNNEILTVEELTRINNDYRSEFKQFRSSLDLEIRRLQKRAKNVRIILLIAALLPALGAAINFVDKKWMRYIVSILAGAGTIFSILGTQLYETDAKGFSIAAGKLSKIKSRFNAKYKICLDRSDYFNTDDRRTKFNIYKGNIETEVSDVLIGIGSTKTVVQDSSKAFHFSLIPAAYAQGVNDSKNKNLFIKASPVIDLQKGVFKNNGIEFQLPEAFKNQVNSKDLVYIGGVGEDSSYDNAKNNAEISFNKKLYETLEQMVIDKDSTIDSIKLKKIVTQGSSILKKIGADPAETSIKNDQYYYLFVKSYNSKQIKNIMNNVLSDAGIKSNIQKDIIGKTTVPVTLSIDKNEPKLLTEPKIKNTSVFKLERNGTKWYDFTVTLDCDSVTLNSIRKVTYNMHSSFRNPTIIKTNKDEMFSYSWVGWGVFNLTADIEYQDGSVKKLSHMLTF